MTDRMYQIWCGMKQRCHYKGHKHYDNYGGRGIKVCDRWYSNYANFLNDMGLPPSKDHQLDRDDSNGNYEPGNVQWSTRSENCKNRRNKRLITANGKTQNLIDWAIELGCKMSTIHRRIHVYKWSEEKAVTTPVMSPFGNKEKTK